MSVDATYMEDGGTGVVTTVGRDPNGGNAMRITAPYRLFERSTTGAAVSVPYHADAVTVSSGGLSGTSKTFNVLGPLDRFTFSGVSTVAQSQPFDLVVRAVDAAGNLVKGYGGSPSWSDASGSLGPSSPAPFVGGVSVNSCTRVGSAQSGDRITVDDTSAGVSSKSPAFSVATAQRFNRSGSYSFALPCAATINVTASGAQGGGGNFGVAGGTGTRLTSDFAVTRRETLNVVVGGAGQSSNSSGDGGGGSFSASTLPRAGNTPATAK